jgi:hypothetical protein
VLRGLCCKWVLGLPDFMIPWQKQISEEGANYSWFVEFPEQKQMWRNQEYHRPWQLFIKAGTHYCLNMKCLSKDSLVKGFIHGTMFICGDWESAWTMRSLSSSMVESIHWLIHNVAELLEKGGKFEGRAWLEEVGHWEMLFSASPHWTPFLGFSLLPHCHVVTSCALSCPLHHDVLPPSGLKQWSQLNIHGLKPLKQK